MTAPMEGLAAALADRYRLEREVGKGGMATVYLAQDLKHHRRVAIKVLHPQLAASVGGDRFLAEIRTTANLQHPHILPLFDSGRVTLAAPPHGAEGEILYYVMPFIEGESLRDRLTREKQLPLEDSLQIMREVADALDYAHRAGVVHRDIKPENIMLSGGHAIVADFGIARAVGDEHSTRLTQTGAVVGTPAYLSPEQVTGEPLDGRSDLYSLGCVLYECLTGEIPFAGPAMSTMAQRVVAPPPSVRARRTETPSQVDQLVARAMATQATDRFSTGREMVAALVAPRRESRRDGRQAMVVLPFANQSPDPENEYFSDGLTEEIISALSGIKSLSVISRTSAMQLKGTTRDVRTIGRDLGVQYVLEGSVRKAGNSLRITTRLIDAASDAQLWGDKYGGTMDDVFEVQERVAREIVKALGISLTSDEDQRLARRAIEHPQAFEWYLQARVEFRRYGSSIDHGMALLDRAIAIEGQTPPLRALAAWAQVSLVRSGHAAGRGGLDEAEAVARALIEEAPEAPYGHALLGFIAYERSRAADAVRHLLAALEREPNDADNMFYLVVSYIAAGQEFRAVDAAARLMASDPLSPLAWMTAGIAPWFTGQVGDALASLVRAVELDEKNLLALWSLGYAYALDGQMTESAKVAETLRLKDPDFTYTRHLLALVAAVDGRRDDALRQLDGVEGLDAHHHLHLAEAFAMAGETDRALSLLEEAVHQGFHPYNFIVDYCPFLAPLRETPRFAVVAALARKRSDEFHP